MIKEFVLRWEANKDKIREAFEKKVPEDYKSIVSTVIENITAAQYKDYAIDPERIHEINDGSYQGTLLYIIAEKGYQPSKYYYVKVAYGSCSGCDTLEDLLIGRIWDREAKAYKPTETVINGLMTLALHIVQGLKEMDGEAV